ncbi:hypothetical protein [Mycobacterium sherrisii]|uniref:hypothetical protein n=1 Tax=Mycobacterium sherrisii TaxID=243061 RepID=UPI0012F5030E|nr:hypothetical protein [Mycobacterium sherrisii]
MVELTRGAILPAELKDLLVLAAHDAKCVMVTLVWSDNSQASTTDIDEIDPIEDAEDIRSVFGKFVYDNRSTLTVVLRRYYRNVLEAAGPSAVQRQSAIAQYWASLPDRSSLTYIAARWVRSLPIALLGGAVTFFIAGFFHGGRHHMAPWALRIGFLLIALCAYLYVRSAHATHGFSKLILLARRPRRDTWTIVAGISGIGALVLSLIAYLFPR